MSAAHHAPPRRHHGSRRARLPRLPGRASATTRPSRSSRSPPRRSPASTTAPSPPRSPARSTPTASRSSPSPSSPAHRRGATSTQVVFAYSDIAHVDLMHKASLVLACGRRLRPARARTARWSRRTSRSSACARCAPAWASAASRAASGERLRERGLRAVDIRHPMPYRDLTAMRVERYASLEDLDRSAPPSRSARSTSTSSRSARSSWPASTTRPSCARPRRRPTSSSGTAATTTCRSSSPTSRSSRSTRTAPATSASTTRARRTSCAPTCSSSTRSTPPTGRERRGRARRGRDASTRRARSSRPTSAIHAEDGERMRGKRVLAIEDGPTVTHGGMALRRRRARRARARRGRARRPAAVRGRLAPRHVRGVPAPHRGAAGDGLLGRAARRPRGDDRGRPVRRRRHRHADRPRRLVEIEQPTVRVTYGVEDVDRARRSTTSSTSSSRSTGWCSAAHGSGPDARDLAARSEATSAAAAPTAAAARF